MVLYDKQIKSQDIQNMENLFNFPLIKYSVIKPKNKFLPDLTYVNIQIKQNKLKSHRKR